MEALVFGLLASSALVIGGPLGPSGSRPPWSPGPMLAFASGTLISALAFGLFPEAVRLGGLRASGWGLLAGAATFVVINAWLDSRVAPPQELAGTAAGQSRKVAVASRGTAGPAGRGDRGRRAREPGPGRVAGRGAGVRRRSLALVTLAVVVGRRA